MRRCIDPPIFSWSILFSVVISTITVLTFCIVFLHRIVHLSCLKHKNLYTLLDHLYWNCYLHKEAKQKPEKSRNSWLCIYSYLVYEILCDRRYNNVNLWARLLFFVRFLTFKKITIVNSNKLYKSWFIFWRLYLTETQYILTLGC